MHPVGPEENRNRQFRREAGEQCCYKVGFESPLEVGILIVVPAESDLLAVSVV